jgi:hypothetical protein
VASARQPNILPPLVPTLKNPCKAPHAVPKGVGRD